eukprot:IDg4720t1
MKTDWNPTENQAPTAGPFSYLVSTQIEPPPSPHRSSPGVRIQVGDPPVPCLEIDNNTATRDYSGFVQNCREGRDKECYGRRGRSYKRDARNPPDRESSHQQMIIERSSRSRSQSRGRSKDLRLSNVDAGASRVAISDEFSCAVFFLPRCLNLIPLLDREAFGLAVGDECGVLLTAMDIRAPGSRTRVRRSFTSASVGDFNPQCKIMTSGF